MQRRSARLSLQPPKNYQEDLDDGAAPGALGRAESEMKGRKRGHDDGSDSSAGDDQPQLKKARRRKGYLGRLVDMPLDIVVEIFNLLDPLDLLHLAWTTKTLRAMLMSRSSAAIWKAARSNVVPKLPECPDNLSEPQYAYFMFVEACHICYRKLNSPRIVWTLWLRICKPCMLSNFQESTYGFKFLYRSDEILSPLLPFLPGIWISSRRQYYHVATHEQWLREYDYAIDHDPVKWAKDTRLKWTKIEKNAAACEAWYNDVVSLRDQERGLAVARRKASIVQYVKKLGWGEELSKMTDSDAKPQDQREVLQDWRKQLSEKALSSLTPFLNDFMKSARDKRLCRERNAMYKQRTNLLQDIVQAYNSALPRGALYPTTADVFDDPRVRSIIEDTPSTVAFKAEHLAPLIPLFPDINLRWVEKVRGQLITLIRESFPEYTFDEKTVLDLAITSFNCRDPHLGAYCRYSEYLHFPSILMHDCATSSFEARFDNGTAPYSLYETRRKVSWNHSNRIHFEPERMEVLAAVVKLCQLDPKTTTRSQMDALDPIFECVPCNHESHGRATMKWWGVLLHYLEKHRAKQDMKLLLVDETSAACVRARIREEELREWSSEPKEFTFEFTFEPPLVCNRCAEQGNLPVLLKHVNARHEISNPTPADVRPCDRSYYYPEKILRFWPPRVIDIDEPSAVEVKVSEVFLQREDTMDI